MDPLKELLDIYFDELTPGVRNYISNSDWLDRLQKLKDEYQLNADQYNTLLTEVTLALFGLTDYVALEVNLRPDLPANIAKPLAEKIETEIFNPIKDQLEDRHEKNKKLDQRAEQLEKLPEQLKQLINSEQTLNSIKLIGGRHKLHMDQIGQLADETFKVVTGETKPYSYVNNLEEKLEIDHELANQITKEINKEIFEPIRQQLKEVHNVGQTTKNQEKPEQKEPEKEKVENNQIPYASRKQTQKSDTPEKEPPRDLFKEKLSGIHQNESQTQADQPKPPQKKEHYKKDDPYREPIE